MTRARLLLPLLLALAGCAGSPGEEDVEALTLPPIATDPPLIVDADPFPGRFVTAQLRPDGTYSYYQPWGGTMSCTLPGCIVNRINFANSGASSAQIALAQSRINNWTGDYARISVLLGGAVSTVTIRDHRDGSIRNEKWFMVEKLYLSPDERAHTLESYVWATGNTTTADGWLIPTKESRTVRVNYAPGVNGPTSFSDIVFAGTLINGTPLRVRAEQYFTRQLQ